MVLVEKLVSSFCVVETVGISVSVEIRVLGGAVGGVMDSEVVE